jgi:hypothetical protein
MAYMQLHYNQEALTMAYVQLCCSSIGTLLRSSDNGVWILNAIFLKLLAYHKLMVNFGLDNLTLFHSSFFIYFSNILPLSVSLLLFLAMCCH